MIYDTLEIMAIVSEVLGDKPDGIYLSEMWLEHDSLNYPLFYSDRNCSHIITDTKNTQIQHGVSRLVIIPTNTNYVIKIPITGLYSVFEQIEDEDGEIVDIIVKPRVVMDVDLDEYNVCEQETSIHNYLLSSVKPIFAKDIYIDEYCGIPIYIQKKVRSAEESISNKTSKFFQKKASNLIEKSQYNTIAGEHRLDDTFVGKVIELYGEDTARALLEECKTIDDLHANNYGYDEDDFPVIFDYAGYEPSMYYY